MKIITMDDFLTNPTGKSSASFARRDLIIADLYNRFDKLTSKASIKCNSYSGNGAYYFHLKIPSEKFLNKLYYDVVLEFIPIGSKNKTSDRTINKYQMRMFSNTPNFVYTYAYVYNKDRNLIDFLKNKINNKALTEEPTVKNPQFIYGFEKSIFFALIHIKKTGLNYISKLNNLPKVNKTSLKSNVEKTDKIQDKYDDLLKKERLERKNKRDNKKLAEKRTTKKSSNNISKPRSNNKTIGNPKKSHFKTKKAKKSLNTHK